MSLEGISNRALLVQTSVTNHAVANALRPVTLPSHSELTDWAHDNFSLNLDSLKSLGHRFVQSTVLRFATDLAVLPVVELLGLATGALPLALGITAGTNLLMLGGQVFGAWREGNLNSINWWDACVTGFISSLPATVLGAATPLVLQKFLPQASTLLRMGVDVFSESLQAFGNAVANASDNTSFGEKFLMELGDSFLNRGVGLGYEAGQFVAKKSVPHLAHVGRGLLLMGGLTTPVLASTGPADISHAGAALLTGSVLIETLRKRRGHTHTNPQSPIAITASSHTLHHDNLKFQYRPINVEYLEHNGYFVDLKVANGGLIIHDGVEYFLQGMHFHTPGEHEVNGKKSPLELHLVHRSKDKEGKILALAVLFDEGEENLTIKNVWENNLPRPGYEKELDGVRFNPADLIPSGDYYPYHGSLTYVAKTPHDQPHPPAHWIVMQTRMTASRAQIDAFHAKTGCNARPIQPLSSIVSEKISTLTEPVSLPIDEGDYSLGQANGKIHGHMVENMVALNNGQETGTKGFGYVLLPNKTRGQIADGGVEYCTRFMVRCVDTGLVVEAHLPVTYLGLSCFERDWKEILKELKRLGVSDPSRLEASMVYGTLGIGLAWDIPPGVRVGEIMQKTGVKIISSQPVSPNDEHIFNLETGEVTIRRNPFLPPK